MPTGIVIYTDTSKSSLCKKLGLDDPYKIDVDATNEDARKKFIKKPAFT